jgi:hypothetical protein
MTTNFDPRDVLMRYMEALDSTSDIVRDAAELPYSKDIVKTVLIGCLTRSGIDEDARKLIIAAYVGLGDFQELTEEEKTAVEKMSNLGEMGELGSDKLKQQAETVARFAPAYQRVLMRSNAERDQLLEELKG